MVEKIIESPQTFIIVSLNAINENSYKEVMGNDTFSLNKTLENVEYLIKSCLDKNRKLDITMSYVVPEEKLDEAETFQKEWENRGIEVKLMNQGNWLSKSEPIGANDFERNYNKINNYVCGMLKQEICFLSNGDYALCCFDAEGEANLNVMNTSIKDAFTSDKYHKTRIYLQENSIKNTMCENCSFVLKREKRLHFTEL